MISAMYDRLFAGKQDLLLEDDHDTQLQTNEFVDQCFQRILTYCETVPEKRLIQRDYEFVPEFIDLKQVRRLLKASVKKNGLTKDYVDVYLTSGRVLNWAIDNRKISISA